MQECRWKFYFKFRKASWGNNYYKMTDARLKDVIVGQTLIQQRSIKTTSITLFTVGVFIVSTINNVRCIFFERSAFATVSISARIKLFFFYYIYVENSRRCMCVCVCVCVREC